MDEEKLTISLDAKQREALDKLAKINGFSDLDLYAKEIILAAINSFKVGNIGEGQNSQSRNPEADVLVSSDISKSETSDLLEDLLAEDLPKVRPGVKSSDYKDEDRAALLRGMLGLDEDSDEPVTGTVPKPKVDTPKNPSPEPLSKDPASSNESELRSKGEERAKNDDKPGNLGGFTPPPRRKS